MNPCIYAHLQFLTKAPKTNDGKRQTLQQMLLEKLGICLQKTETSSMFIILYKYQLVQWIKNFNIRTETLKPVQKRAGIRWKQEA
jgi:hypothetical protein